MTSNLGFTCLTQDRRFANVTVLLFAPQHNTRALLVSALRGVGIENIRPVSNVTDADACIVDQQFDLLIAEVTNVNRDVLQFVRSVRRGKLGNDPFLPVVLTTWAPQSDLVQEMLGCGADNVISRPFSNVQLGERVDAIVRGRRHFVATGGYIGPDRRAGNGRHASDGAIEVPNALRAKVNGDHGSLADPEAVRSAMMALRADRIRRDALQIAALAGSIRQDFEAAGNSGKARQGLARLFQFANSLRKCVAKTEHAYLEHLCVAVTKVAENIRKAGASPAARDFALLEETAAALRLTVVADNSGVGAAKPARESGAREPMVEYKLSA